MSRGSEKSRIVQSILDRLIDDDPFSSVDPTPDESILLRIVQQSIRRDLQDLLNSRIRCVPWLPQYTELETSLVNYGLPDFTAASLDAASDPDILIEAIRKAIDIFEPRLTEVRIRQLQNEFELNRTFLFRIEATVLINEKKHMLLYDSQLESTTGQFNVK